MGSGCWRLTLNQVQVKAFLVLCHIIRGAVWGCSGKIFHFTFLHEFLHKFVLMSIALANNAKALESTQYHDHSENNLPFLLIIPKEKTADSSSPPRRRHFHHIIIAPSQETTTPPSLRPQHPILRPNMGRCNQRLLPFHTLPQW